MVVYRGLYYPLLDGFGQVSNETNSLELLTQVGSIQTLFLDRVNISVVEAAQGGGGILELKNTTGTVVYAVNVDTAKDLLLDFGDASLTVGQNEGLIAVVSGAATQQAKVSISVSGYISF